MDPLDHKIWLPFDNAMVVALSCVCITLIDGWEKSYGIGEETKAFKRMGKPIFTVCHVLDVGKYA